MEVEDERWGKVRLRRWDGLHYLKIGWKWVNRALSRGWDLITRLYLSGMPDPEPAMASRKQQAKRALPTLKPSFTNYASVICL